MPEALNFTSQRTSDDQYGHKEVVSFDVRWNPEDEEDKKAVRDFSKESLASHLVSRCVPGTLMAHATVGSNMKRNGHGKSPSCTYSVVVHWNNSYLEDLASAMYLVWEPNDRSWSRYVDQLGNGAEDFRDMARKLHEVVKHFPAVWNAAEYETVAETLYVVWDRHQCLDRQWTAYLQKPDNNAKFFRKMATAVYQALDVREAA